MFRRDIADITLNPSGFYKREIYVNATDVLAMLFYAAGPKIVTTNMRMITNEIENIIYMYIKCEIVYC